MLFIKSILVFLFDYRNLKWSGTLNVHDYRYAQGRLILGMLFVILPVVLATFLIKSEDKLNTYLLIAVLIAFIVPFVYLLLQGIKQIFMRWRSFGISVWLLPLAWAVAIFADFFLAKAANIVEISVLALVLEYVLLYKKEADYKEDETIPYDNSKWEKFVKLIPVIAFWASVAVSTVSIVTQVFFPQVQLPL